MGKCAEHSPEHLKAACPRCGAEVSAISLRELGRRLAAHCRKSKATAEFPKGVLPELPAGWEFDCKIESQNATTYSHWTIYHAYKRKWQKRVRQQMSGVFGLVLPYSRWRLTRYHKHPHQLMDYANFVGGAKPLVDCLITYGIIADDSPNHFDCTYVQECGPVRVRLELLGLEPITDQG